MLVWRTLTFGIETGEHKQELYAGLRHEDQHSFFIRYSDNYKIITILTWLMSLL